MDIDQMKSTTLDQIELMMMMSELSSDIVPAATGAPSLPGLPWRQEPSPSSSPPSSSRGAMREVVFRIAAMQPIRIDPEAVRAPRRRNVRISSDPQSVAARRRRERISERIRILQRIVPGGTKMDTASMLDEAVHYVKFLKTQVQTLSSVGGGCGDGGFGFPVAMYSGSYNNMNMDVVTKAYAAQNVEQ